MAKEAEVRDVVLQAVYNHEEADCVDTEVYRCSVDTVAANRPDSFVVVDLAVAYHNWKTQQTPVLEEALIHGRGFQGRSC